MRAAEFHALDHTKDQQHGKDRADQHEVLMVEVMETRITHRITLLILVCHMFDMYPVLNKAIFLSPAGDSLRDT